MQFDACFRAYKNIHPNPLPRLRPCMYVIRQGKCETFEVQLIFVRLSSFEIRKLSDATVCCWCHAAVNSWRCCAGSCVLPGHFVTYWKTLTSDAAFKVLQAFAVHAVHGVDVCSGHTVRQCPLTAPSQRRSSVPVDTASALIRTDPTWTWDSLSRGVPALKVDLMKTLVRQLTRRTWHQLQRQPSSPNSRVCRLQSRWSATQTTWAPTIATSTWDTTRCRRHSSAASNCCQLSGGQVSCPEPRLVTDSNYAHRHWGRLVPSTTWTSASRSILLSCWVITNVTITVVFFATFAVCYC